MHKNSPIIYSFRTTAMIWYSQYKVKKIGWLVDFCTKNIFKARTSCPRTRVWTGVARDPTTDLLLYLLTESQQGNWAIDPQITPTYNPFYLHSF